MNIMLVMTLENGFPMHSKLSTIVSMLTLTLGMNRPLSTPRTLFAHNGHFLGVYYRPQRSWAKVMFLQASVILLTGGGLPQCMLGYPPGPDPPLAPLVHPLWHPPPLWHLPSGTPPSGTPPPRADPGIRSMSGRYASYWNAFLS